MSLEYLFDKATSVLENLENHVLVLEEAQDIPTLFTVYESWHALAGIGRFIESADLKDIANQILDVLDGVHKDGMQQIPVLIDPLLGLTEKMSDWVGDLKTELKSTGKPASGTDALPSREPLDHLLEDIKNVWSTCRTDISAPTDLSTKGQAPIKWPPGMKDNFFVEAREGLAVLEQSLLTLEKQPEAIELFNEMFRRLHSLKGNAGIMLAVIADETTRHAHSLTPFHDLAHKLESMMAGYRDSKTPFSREGIDLLFKTIDTLNALLPSISEDQPGQIDLHPLFLALNNIAEATNTRDQSKIVSRSDADPKTGAFLNTADQCLEMMAQAMSDFTEPPLNPKTLKKYRRSVKTLFKAAKVFNQPDIMKKTTALLEGVAAFQSDTGNKEVIEGLSEARTYITELNQRINTLHKDLEKKETPEPLDIAVETPVSGPAIDTGMVHVPQKQLDGLMNLVGELVITKNSFIHLSQKIGRRGGMPQIAQAVKQTGSQINRISDELQNRIMDIRLVPIQTIFPRFQRLVRDLARSSGKPLELTLEGQNVQLDKSILEQISDPIMHLLRNSADHGIESPRERIAAGKSEQPSLILSAKSIGQSVLVEIRDDGRGLDPNKIAAKAISKGLITTRDLETLDTQTIFDLIFQPGFSTAETVTEVSGRGVGMDVVRTTLEKIGGKVELESTQGQGSCIRLTIPQSLAVTRGLMVLAGGKPFILPLESILEMVKVPSKNIRCFKDALHLIEIRQHVLPVIQLAEALALNSEHTSAETHEQKDMLCSLVIIATENETFALQVDQFLQEVEIMVKPIESTLGKIPGISGTTILSDGRVLLVLNPLELQQY